MIDKLTRIFKHPYPLYLDFSISLPIIVGISIFVPLFLILFQRFDVTVYRRNLHFGGYGIVTVVVLSFNAHVLPRIFPNTFNEDKWTLGKGIPRRRQE